MRILVAGGGIGGLSAALSLHAAGYTGIQIFEAVRTLRPVGLGLNILPDAVRELTELGLYDRLAARAVPTRELRFFSRHGRPIWTEPRGVAAGYHWPQLSVPRSSLQEVLLEAVRERLGPGAVVTGVRVAGCTPGDGAVAQVELVDEHTAARRVVPADLVVGADGIHSAVRAALYPEEGAPPGNGMVMWRGTTWTEPFLSGRTMAVAGDDVRRIVLYPITEDPRRGRVLANWVAAHPARGGQVGAADWLEQAPLDRVLTEFGDWRFDWVDLPSVFQGAPRIHRYPMVDRDPLPRWSFGNVTLIGDAAHAMYPMGSNGATQSIVDGRVLAHALAGADGIEQALRDYEQRRRPGMTRLQESNRGRGPEAIITTVHLRAPEGFTDLREVVPETELAEAAAHYARTSGGEVHLVNTRPSLTTADRKPSMTELPTTSSPDRRAREPIAVIGMACRFAGADSPAALWEVLREGRDTTGETPRSRYNAEALYSPSPRPGTVISRRGGYLDGVAAFDAEFFGMTESEARTVDPQHRLALTTAWEALEDAGVRASRLAGSRTGVYLGASYEDYFGLMTRGGLDTIDVPALGSMRSLLPARLSYLLDLRGPSICVDTACSSSLVAVHLAVQSLRIGECGLALAGGVNLKLLPDRDVLFSRARVLAPDGRCKFGDAGADGAAFSEGVGVLVLKPLARALADGDRVRAVILGSAVTNDGASSGSLLTPSVEAHAEMLRWAYEDAGVTPSDVDFVEAHGTGTQMIDPVEFAGLAEVLGEGRPADRPCYVGSVKSNIGHAESAGGVAGLIKTVLCLEHRQVAPSLHFTNPNPAVDWARIPLVVPTAPQSLPDRGRPVLAGVSGQGISSVNAHIVLARADPAPRERPPAQPGRCHLLPLSARSQQALTALARSYLDHLAGPGRAEAPRDVCFSAAVRREHHPYRLIVAGRNHDELAEQLRRHLDGDALDVAAGPAADYLAGLEVDWLELTDPDARFVPLPTYQWQNRDHWLEVAR